LVVDHADAALSTSIERLGIRPLVTATVMNDPGDRPALAGRVIEFTRLFASPAARRARA
jgi:hypothetical protein